MGPALQKEGRTRYRWWTKKSRGLNHLKPVYQLVGVLLALALGWIQWAFFFMGQCQLKKQRGEGLPEPARMNYTWPALASWRNWQNQLVSFWLSERYGKIQNTTSLLINPHKWIYTVLYLLDPTMSENVRLTPKNHTPNTKQILGSIGIYIYNIHVGYIYIYLHTQYIYILNINDSYHWAFHFRSHLTSSPRRHDDEGRPASGCTEEA